MSEYQDKEIPCVDCPGQKTFTWSARDQEFFAKKQFSAPKRCKEHAAAKRKAHADREKRESSAFHPKNIQGYDGHRQSDAKMLEGVE